MRGLGAYIFLDQGICRLSVKAESVFEGPQVWALFEESFLQPISSGMKVLLQKKEIQVSKLLLNNEGFLVFPS